MTNSFFNKYPVLEVKQPFGTFYVVSMKAKDLLLLQFSDVLRYDENKRLSGSQRKLDLNKRVKDITSYINGDDTAFPNSIIVSANYTQEGLIEDDEELRWRIEEEKGQPVLVIPSDKKLAAVIDGQHRINGFEKADEERKDMELIVVIYLDLPNPYQAYLFATINYHQKPVDKSLALEQFGFLTEIKPPELWSPELLAVHLSKRFNFEADSPFYNHIKVAPQNDEFLLEYNPKQMDWLISSATVVDGILKLISSNPREDNNRLRKMEQNDRIRSEIDRDDASPLREFYLMTNDVFIYKVVYNFFTAVNEKIFKPNLGKNTYIKKTVGIQALFEVLKEILSVRLKEDKNISLNYFENIVENFSSIDFGSNFFTASGIGKSRIRNIILIRLGFKNLTQVSSPEEYFDLL